MPKAKKSKKKNLSKSISNTKLLFISVVLLLIVFEALYVVKGQLEPSKPQVAGVSTQK